MEKYDSIYETTLLNIIKNCRISTINLDMEIVDCIIYMFIFVTVYYV